MHELESKKVSAIILAGGRGLRMGNLCSTRPKPLLPFAGQFKVIDLVLSNCLNSGINRIAAAVEYHGSSLEKYLNDWHRHHSSIDFLRVLFPPQGTYAGTADAIYQNLDLLNQWNSDLVLVLAGDHIYHMDYRQMIDYHVRVQADVTIGTVSVPFEDAQRFGIILSDSTGRVVEFEEKPQHPKSTQASMGIYVFSIKALEKFLSADARNPGSKHDFGYNVIPELIQKGKCFSYRFHDYWKDIGTPKSYLSANLEFSLQQWDIHTCKTDCDLPIIDAKATVIDSIISPGCIIKGTVIHSVLSPGVIVEENSQVIDSIVMKNARIEKHCLVENSIIDEGELVPGCFHLTACI